ncbi:MAG: DMT family transporter [Proteobacteria bacterium]|nr:DMT family transporter [Pseudomonadota bacterium]
MTTSLSSPPASRRPDNVTGILWMVAATFIAVTTHAMIRHVAETGMHPFEIGFFYNLFTMLIIIPMVARNGTGFLRTRRHGLMFVRAVLHLTSMLLFYVGLTLAPLAAASALTFLAPLFAVLLAAIFLREGFPLRRIIALVIGFSGMLIIVQPGPSALDTGALYFVGAASLWGAVLLIIKIMSRTESSATITAWMTIMMTPMALLPAIPYWTTPSLTDIGWLAAAGLLGAFAQWALTQALKTGSTNAIMPIDFLRLVWGALIGFAIFSEIPDIFTWVGGVVIFGSSMWLAWRERAAMQAENKRRAES